MHILVVRHAIAEERGARPGIAEVARALTHEGAQRMSAAAAGLRRLLPSIAVIGHSPLRRARETAEILATTYPSAGMTAVEALAPGGEPMALERWIASAGAGPVAVVGHEPDLGHWIARLLSGEPAPFAPLKKGGACLLHLDHGPAPAAAKLEWMLPPRVLRALAQGSNGDGA